MPQQINLNVDFDFRDNRIVDIKYDEDKGYRADGLLSASMNGLDARYTVPTFTAIEQAVEKEYYTTPVVKTFGEKHIVLVLPLDQTISADSSDV